MPKFEIKIIVFDDPCCAYSAMRDSAILGSNSTKGLGGADLKKAVAWLKDSMKRYNDGARGSQWHRKAKNDDTSNR